MMGAVPVGPRDLRVRKMPDPEPGRGEVGIEATNMRSNANGMAIACERWSRHSDLNRGPAIYEVGRPERCGTSVEWRA